MKTTSFARFVLAAALVVSQLALPLAAGAAATPNSAQGAKPAASQPQGSQFAPDQVIIQFKPGAGPNEKANARAAVSATQKEVIRTSAKGDLELATLPPGTAVADAVQRLERQPAVAFAEPNWIYTHQATSTDPYYTNGSLWGMYGDATSPANQYGSQAGEAWAAGNTGNATVYVGVIDEGIQHSHPDLQGNVDAANGWDFYNDDSTTYDGTGDDHGTHVAGSIGALGGNGQGVAGMAWSVKMIPAKFLGPNGGYLSDAVKAVDHLTNLKRTQGLNIVASNNSWGGGGYSQALHDAIIRAAKADILFIAAAGNGDRWGNGINNDTTASYPSNYDTSIGTSTESAASYDAVIAVAAIDNGGNKATWSNYGVKTVDLGAPGVGVYSTLPESVYGSYSGTSMATPHVSGAVALYGSAFPTASAAEIKAAILQSTVPTDSLAGKTVTGGRLNASGFVAQSTPPATDTTAPTGEVKINSDATYTDSTSVTLTLSASDGSGSGVAEMRFSNDGSTWTAFEAYATSKVYTLPSGDGTKTVYAQFKDVAGNISDSASDSIVLDTTAPVVANTAPADAATEVAVSANVTATFSEAMDAASITTSTFTLASSAGAVTAVVSYNPDTKTATLDPSSDLAAGQTYTATLTTGAKDVAGNPLAANVAWSFTTASSSTAPAPSTMHVGDLDGTSTKLQKGQWEATVTIRVHDGAEKAVSGATVSGTFSQGSWSKAISCTTDTNGACSVGSGAFPSNDGKASFTVSGVSGTLTYEGAANHDPDGDSNGTTIQLSK